VGSPAGAVTGSGKLAESFGLLGASAVVLVDSMRVRLAGASG
jgi:hypothetical protein